MVNGCLHPPHLCKVIDQIYGEHPHASEVTVTPDVRGWTLTARTGVGKYVTVRVPIN